MDDSFILLFGNHGHRSCNIATIIIEQHFNIAHYLVAGPPRTPAESFFVSFVCFVCFVVNKPTREGFRNTATIQFRNVLRASGQDGGAGRITDSQLEFPFDGPILDLFVLTDLH